MRRMIAISAWLLTACGGCGETDVAAERGPTAEPSASVQDLYAADRTFNDEVAANGATAWASWFAEDGAQVVPGHLVCGRASILELMGGFFADSTVSLTWEPDYGEIAASGDLGFTTGRFTMQRGSGDSQTGAEGRYITVWRLTPDGVWRVALDGGVPDGP